MSGTSPATTPKLPRPYLLGALACLGIIAFLPLIFTLRERALDTGATRAVSVSCAFADLFSTLREGENGSRGYLLTGDPTSLNTFNEAMADAPQEYAALDRLVGNGPERAQMPAIHQLTEDKLAQLSAIMARIQAGDKAGATSLIGTDLNLGTMVRLRTLVATVHAEDERVALRDQRAESFDGWVLFAVTLVAMAGIALVGWAALRRERVRRRALLHTQAELRGVNSLLQQKVAERNALLSETEQRFNSLAEMLPGFVYLSDGTKTIYVNAHYVTFTGTGLDSDGGFGWTTLIHPDDVAAAEARWTDCVARGVSYEAEYRLRRHDGQYRWVIDRAVPLRDADGAITAWIGASTDIDDRKTAEAQLARANETLEHRVAERSAELDSIFRLSLDILSVWDWDGGLITMSPAWERILGRPPAAPEPGHFNPLLHPDDVAATREARARLATGQAFSIENRIQHADGSWRWLAWRAVPDMEHKRVYAVARDVTEERARAEHLRQSQKMEAIGQLTGGIAHDFNNLLTIIIGSLEPLRADMAKGDPKQARRADAAMEAARRAASLVHRLLTFSRRQKLEPKPLDVNRLLAGMSDLLHRTLGDNVTMRLATGAALAPAMADANQLENAILNLAINARDAMPHGGTLSIGTQNAYLDDDDAAARGGLRPGHYVTITVTDTGEGMTREVMERIFEPFFTTKPPGQGTGLGLAQVQGFIRESGGHVEARSTPGKGTTVRLYLPRAG